MEIGDLKRRIEKLKKQAAEKTLKAPSDEGRSAESPVRPKRVLSTENDNDLEELLK